ncbi:hypothetical protein F4803DRAFT_545392, partial [Xylaria telfairii]
MAMDPSPLATAWLVAVASACTPYKVVSSAAAHSQNLLPSIALPLGPRRRKRTKAYGSVRKCTEAYGGVRRSAEAYGGLQRSVAAYGAVRRSVRAAGCVGLRRWRSVTKVAMCRSVAAGKVWSTAPE